MDGEFFHVDSGVREIGYALLASLLLSAYVAVALRRQTAGDRGGLRRELWGRHASLALIGVAGAVGIACVASSEIVDYAFREGGVFESISAGSFLSVFLLGGVHWIFLRDRSLVNAGLMSLGLAGFLDEVSYGMQLFEFRPAFLGGIRIDGFHDVLEWAWRGERVTPVVSPAALTIVLAIAAAGMLIGAWRRRDWIAGAIREGFSSPAVWYVPWILVFGLGSCAIDFAVWGMALGRVRDVGPFVEEALEMSAALSLCYAWYANRRTRQFDQSQSQPAIFTLSDGASRHDASPGRAAA